MAFDSWDDFLPGPLGLNLGRLAMNKLGLTQDPNELRDSEEFKRVSDAADQFAAEHGIDRTRLAETRNMDLDTIARLRAAEEGKTPSAAEMLMRKAVDQNAGAALGTAATLGGFNPGAALRAGMQQQAQGGQMAAADIAALRAKEMEAARQMLAEQTRSASQRDAGSALGTGNLQLNAVTAPLTAMTNLNAANQAATGTVLGAAGKAIGLSDETTKDNISVDPRAADAFLSTLKPKTFEYENTGPNMPPGRRLGVMAQDLPQSDVVTGPDGKKWISADVIGNVLAGMGRLNEKVEGKRGMPGTVAGNEDEHRAAMEYMTQPRRDAGTAGRVAGGRAPLPRSMTKPDDELGIQDEMVSRSAVHDYLAGLGIIH